MVDDPSGNDRSDLDDARPRTDESAGATDSDGGPDRIPIDLSGRRDRERGVDEDRASDSDDEPYAPEPRSTPIEPGTPTLENAAFVLFGAILTVFVLFRLSAIVVG